MNITNQGVSNQNSQVPQNQLQIVNLGQVGNLNNRPISLGQIGGLLNNIFNIVIDTNKQINSQKEATEKLEKDFQEIKSENNSLKLQLDRVNAEMDKIKLEKEKEVFCKRYENTNNLLNKIHVGLTVTTGFVSPHLVPVSLLLNGVEYSQRRSVSGEKLKIEKLEREYRNEHPNCSPTEAFNYSKEKLQAIELEELEELGKTTPNEPCVDIDY